MARTKREQVKVESLPDQLRAAIGASGLTAYALGQLAGVDPAGIFRFARGEKDLALATAGRIAAALGLELVQRKGHRPGHART